MSDTGRQDLGDKAKSTMTPDSQKSTLDQAKDSASSTYDSAASSMQPDDQKSTTQKATDTTSSEGGSMMDKVKDTFGGSK